MKIHDLNLDKLLPPSFFYIWFNTAESIYLRIKPSISLFLSSFLFPYIIMPEIIKEGYLSLKEEGLRAWIWSKRYCVLRDQSLTFHRNEVIT